MPSKCVIITGASRGIGRACALHFARLGGWRIVITAAASREALEALAAELRTFPDTDCLAVIADAADEASIRALYAETDRAFGAPDVLISNAGCDWVGLLQDMPLIAWERLMAVNVTGAFLCIREAIPRMLKKGSGSILLMSSVYGQAGAACEAAYAASKGAINALTRSLSQELSGSGIKVNALAPGAVDTAMNGYLSDDDRLALAEDIPAGRLCTPEEVAALAYDITCCHPYLTGQIITLDGGWT